MTTTCFTTKEIFSNGLILRVHSDGSEQIACPDCNNWVHAEATGVHSKIRHSKRCDLAKTLTVAVVKPSAVEQVRSQSEINQRRASGESPANGLSNDERLALVQQGLISVSEAMNSDF